MNFSRIQEWIDSARAWVEANLLTTSTAIEAGCIVGALFVALILARPAKRFYTKLFDWLPDRWRDAVARLAGEISSRLSGCCFSSRWLFSRRRWAGRITSPTSPSAC
jgi:hypothetical protein